MTIDAFTFEILRHRLWSINIEGAMALQRVSGSPLATEAFDMNTSLMSGEGEVVFVGPYLLTGPMGQGLIVRRILEDYGENPGIEPGDMFISNDPYSGAAHQNCVTVVAPIHVEARILAWCGATLHVIDVGGPRAGQVGFGASSIFEEAPVIPPLKIVRAGKLLKDVEANYLRRSRTPALNALDLRGKVAALNTISRRVSELASEYGVESIRDVMDGTIERSEATLRKRLSDLPDGSYRHTAYLDRSDVDPAEYYAVHLSLQKKSDRLEFDWTESSPQAGAVVNCTRSALMSGVLVGVLTYLGYETDWCPAAVERVVAVKSEMGTVVDATWPAGCSMATMAAGFAATTATAVCLGRLLAATAEGREHAMAAWAGAVGSVDVFGFDHAERPFATVLLDGMICGTGARSRADGIDGGGFLRSIGCVVANVETYEARFPFMYLYRRLEPDTGGPGQFRGGVGCSYAVVPRGVDEIPSITPHFSGTQQPESSGLLGGYPGGVNQPFFLRDADVAEMFAAGIVPTTPEELGGETHPAPGIAHLPLGAGDAFGVVMTGGGGWGDPLDREPLQVAEDVASQLVSEQAAKEIYGVVLDPGGTPNMAASDEQRRLLKERRAELAGAATTPPRTGLVHAGEVAGLFELTSEDTPEGSRCRRCGHRFSGDHHSGSALPFALRPLSVAGTHMAPLESEPLFHLVESYCPGCWRLVHVERVPGHALLRMAGRTKE